VLPRGLVNAVRIRLETNAEFTVAREAACGGIFSDHLKIRSRLVALGGTEPGSRSLCVMATHDAYDDGIAGSRSSNNMQEVIIFRFKIRQFQS
jgi:hypothetical protein